MLDIKIDEKDETVNILNIDVYSNKIILSFDLEGISDYKKNIEELQTKICNAVTTEIRRLIKGDFIDYMSG